MADHPSFRQSMPPKMQRQTVSGGHERAAITRAGVHSQSIPTLRTGAAKNANLQPAPISAPSFPKEENGFSPDGPLPSNPNDAQSRQCDAPPIEQTTEKPSLVPTEAKPPEEGETSPTPSEASDPGPTGGAEKPGYSGLVVGHPVGYPADRK